MRGHEGSISGLSMLGFQVCAVKTKATERESWGISTSNGKAFQGPSNRATSALASAYICLWPLALRILGS